MQLQFNAPFSIMKLTIGITFFLELNILRNIPTVNYDICK